MRILYRARALLVYALITIGIVFGVAPAAHAYPTTFFYACGGKLCSFSHTEGWFTWYNRTTGVQGHVVDVGRGSTTAIFEAYAGTRKIDSTTRTADDQSSLTGDRSFNFTIGDTNLVGGIDRIKVTVCVNDSGSIDCGVPWNFWRPPLS